MKFAKTKAVKIPAARDNRNSADVLAKLAEQIAAAEGTRCKARTIQPADILKAIEEVENNLGIPVKYMTGIKVDIDIHAQTFPSAYHGTPESTQFRAERRSAGWFVTDIRRTTTRSASKRFQVELTEDAKAAILKRMSEW